MTQVIGKNRNTNDTAIISDAIELNVTTSTKISDANEKRTFFRVDNSSQIDVFVKLQSAATDNDKKGIIVKAECGWEMPNDNIYTGEISAIASVNSPEIYVTEY